MNKLITIPTQFYKTKQKLRFIAPAFSSQNPHFVTIFICFKENQIKKADENHKKKNRKTEKAEFYACI